MAMDAIIVLTGLLAVIAALMVFASATLLGAWVVRRMRMPQDLPDELRLSPAPPACRAESTREQARATAAIQARLTGIHALALQAAVHARDCAELALQARALVGRGPAGAGQAQAAESAEAEAALAHTAATTAERTRLLSDPEQAEQATREQLEIAAAAHAEAEAAMGAVCQQPRCCATGCWPASSSPWWRCAPSSDHAPHDRRRGGRAKGRAGEQARRPTSIPCWARAQACRPRSVDVPAGGSPASGAPGALRASRRGSSRGEKAARAGISALEDRELIALLLRTGGPGEDALALAAGCCASTMA